jgi:hypothetical protein
MENKYLSPEDVCKMIPGMTTGLLSQMRFRGDGPSYIKASPRKIVYAVSEIERYLASKQQSVTSQRVSA